MHGQKNIKRVKIVVENSSFEIKYVWGVKKVIFNTYCNMH
jgi:hypothetical protein